MSTKIFTEADMEELRACPYVQKVSSNQVFFSAVFKEELWKRINDGMHPRDAIRELGINPEILGENRVAGLKAIVRKEAATGDGFRDYLTFTSGTPKQVSPEAKIRFLEQQLEYKDQEIEFLKKIVSLGKGEAT